MQKDFVIPSGTDAKHYSAAPVKTGEKWIDGKDVYRVVLKFPSICSVANQYLQVGDKIDTVCRFSGFMIEFEGEYTPLPMALPGYEIHVAVVNNYGSRGNPNTINISTSQRHNANGLFIIDYTRVNN